MSPQGANSRAQILENCQMRQENIAIKNIKSMIRTSHSEQNIQKISLDHEGALLRCRKPTNLLIMKTAGRKNRKPPLQIHENDILLYLGCWFFPKKLQITKQNAAIIDDEYLRATWNYPRYDAILNFLCGEQIAGIAFSGIDPRIREKKAGSLIGHSLYQAALYLYMHFELATLEKK